MTSLLNLSLGSSNVFADFGHPDADLEQARAILAAKIMGVLDGHGLSTRASARLTGVSRVDFSRIRSTRLGGFTLERMLAILGRLDQSLDSQSLGKLWDALDVEAILLSPEDQRIFAVSVLNPPEPTDALRRAFEKRRELFGARATFRLEALASRHDRSVFASGEELPHPSKSLVCLDKANGQDSQGIANLDFGYLRPIPRKGQFSLNARISWLVRNGTVPVTCHRPCKKVG